MTVGEGIVIATAIYVGAGVICMPVVIVVWFKLIGRLQARQDAAMSDFRQRHRREFSGLRPSPATPPPPKKGD